MCSNANQRYSNLFVNIKNDNYCIRYCVKWTMHYVQPLKIMLLIGVKPC